MPPAQTNRRLFLAPALASLHATIGETERSATVKVRQQAELRPRLKAADNREVQ
jgi:hypothetical protein